MKIEKILDKNLILAIIIKDSDWEQGLTFPSSEQDFQQVGLWRYNKGVKLAPHVHLAEPRNVLRTQEVVFIKKGRMRADIYTENEKFLKSIELNKGDTAILLNGGHGYEILEDDTMVLEVKNGPYAGSDKEKERI